MLSGVVRAMAACALGSIVIQAVLWTTLPHTVGDHVVMDLENYVRAFMPATACHEKVSDR